MQKIFIGIVIIIFLCVSINSDEIESKIFESVEKSVVYIEASLFLDKKDFSNQELIKKVEANCKAKILDSYLTIQSGSGFFISKSGYVLTNEHVIYIKDLNISKIEVYNGIIYNFLSAIPEDVLNASDYKIVKSDLKKAIDNSKLYYRIMVNNKDYYECEIINSNKDLDAAIIKVKGNQIFKPILMGDSNQLKVGGMALTIGYPWASIFFELFKDLKSTMTTGTISAIRSDNWGVQHTAAINPGNSGGPLLNKNGEVVGINVGVIYVAKGLYYSIPIN